MTGSGNQPRKGGSPSAEEIEMSTATTAAFIERHHGSKIMHDAEDGYYAGDLGYCDTLDEIKREIDDAIAEEQEHYADIDVPADTPSLAAPWWSQR